MAKNSKKSSTKKNNDDEQLTLYTVTVCIGDWWAIQVPARTKTEARLKVLNDNYDKSRMTWLSGDYPKPTKDNKHRISVQPWDADNKNTADGDQKPINYRQEIKFGSVVEAEE